MAFDSRAGSIDQDRFIFHVRHSILELLRALRGRRPEPNFANVLSVTRRMGSQP